MDAILCPCCGGKEFRNNGKFMICEYCDTQFLASAILGTSASSNIDLDDDVQRLLEKCRQDPAKARKYANLILDIDPDNTEALIYL